MSRTGLQRLDAIPAAIERGEEFQRRVKEASGDTQKCADLMAEAIEMGCEARRLEVIGRSGRKMMCMEEIKAAHCMRDAREAYLKARGSNVPPD